MAGEPSAGSAELAKCSPCRGTGQVSSALGGSPHVVRCPWCGGSGEFQAGWDAQQHVAEAGAEG